MTTIGRPRNSNAPLWLWLSVAVIIILGVFFRCYNLDRKVFWEDEILGAIHAYGYTEAQIVAASPRLSDASDVRAYLQPNRDYGVATTVESLAAEDPQHPPAYYLITHLWTQAFGGSIEALRAPAAIFGVFVIPCVFWLALELFGSLTTALIAAALAAVSPFFVLYSQEAREYSLWTAVIALVCVVFLRAIRSNRVATWIVYLILTAASLYIYPLSGLVALGLALYLFIRERGRLTRTMLACVLANLSALALFAPWIKAMMTSSGVTRGMAQILTSRLPAAQIARIFARDLRLVFFDIGSSHLGPLGHSALDSAFTLVVVALCIYAIVSLVRNTTYAVWGCVAIGLCLSMTPLLVRDLLGGGGFVYQGRYFLPLLLGMQLSVAALFARALFESPGVPKKAAWSTLAAVLIGAEILSCATASQATTWWSKDDERAPAVAALVNAAPKPLVVSNYFTPSILELSLYLDPSVPMRLHLKCAQCASPAGADVAFRAGSYQSVFAVQPLDAANRAHYRIVNPVPFPADPDPLDMFTAVSPVR